MSVGSIEKADGVRTSSEESGISRSTISGRTVLILIGVAVILRVGQEIFVPLALALLLTFTLAPIVGFLRTRHIPKIAAVLLAVAFAFVTIATFSFVVATQVANLAENIPTYQRNIVAKVDALTHAGSDNSVLQKIQKVVERVGDEFKLNAAESQRAAPVPAIEQRQPLPVEIVTRSNPIETLGNLIIPLISPFATAGLVVVLVIFMLLEREDLRDRFIRLVGLGDLHKTTAALQDAGRRVGKYLLMQLVVNTLYAVPITAGLWLLGIPNAILWGLLTLVLRFVPYIGPLIGMILPLFLALAIAPGWSLVAWVAGLFIATELISNNVIEPWLYGSHTGLSSLSIIVSAIFWSWLWGPVGLMLSTPLTVCLVVLGRHVPQFDFLGVLLGNEAVLRPHEKLYQRLLAGDPYEATDNAEELLAEEYLADYYETVAIPALVLGETDRQRGVMTEQQIALVASTALTLVENLAEIGDDEKVEEGHASPNETADLPDGRGRTVACIGGRSALDQVAASMVAQVLAIQGADVTTTPEVKAGGTSISLMEHADTVVVTFLNGSSKSQARQAVRRLKRVKPGLRVGVLMPAADGDQFPIVAAEELNADFVASSIRQAIRDALSNAAAVELKARMRRLSRPTERPSVDA